MNSNSERKIKSMLTVPNEKNQNALISTFLLLIFLIGFASKGFAAPALGFVRMSSTSGVMFVLNSENLSPANIERTRRNILTLSTSAKSENLEFNFIPAFSDLELQPQILPTHDLPKSTILQVSEMLNDSSTHIKDLIRSVLFLYKTSSFIELTTAERGRLIDGLTITREILDQVTRQIREYVESNLEFENEYRSSNALTEVTTGLIKRIKSSCEASLAK
jgi:hypothetical protein